MYSAVISIKMEGDSRLRNPDKVNMGRPAEVLGLSPVEPHTTEERGGTGRDSEPARLPRSFASRIGAKPPPCTTAKARKVLLLSYSNVVGVKRSSEAHTKSRLSKLQNAMITQT